MKPAEQAEADARWIRAQQLQSNGDVASAIAVLEEIANEGGKARAGVTYWLALLYWGKVREGDAEAVEKAKQYLTETALQTDDPEAAKEAVNMLYGAYLNGEFGTDLKEAKRWGKIAGESSKHHRARIRYIKPRPQQRAASAHNAEHTAFFTTDVEGNRFYGPQIERWRKWRTAEQTMLIVVATAALIAAAGLSWWWLCVVGIAAIIGVRPSTRYELVRKFDRDFGYQQYDKSVARAAPSVIDAVGQQPHGYVGEEREI